MFFYYTLKCYKQNMITFQRFSVLWRFSVNHKKNKLEKINQVLEALLEKFSHCLILEISKFEYIIAISKYISIQTYLFVQL